MAFGPGFDTVGNPHFISQVFINKLLYLGFVNSWLIYY